LTIEEAKNSEAEEEQVSYGSVGGGLHPNKVKLNQTLSGDGKRESNGLTSGTATLIKKIRNNSSGAAEAMLSDAYDQQQQQQSI